MTTFILLGTVLFTILTGAHTVLLDVRNISGKQFDNYYNLEIEPTEIADDSTSSSINFKQQGIYN